MEELGSVALEEGSPATAGGGRDLGEDDEDGSGDRWRRSEKEEVAEEGESWKDWCSRGGGAPPATAGARRDEGGGAGSRSGSSSSVDTSLLLLPSSLTFPVNNGSTSIYMYLPTLHIKSLSLSNCKSGPLGFCEPRSIILNNGQN